MKAPDAQVPKERRGEKLPSRTGLVIKPWEDVTRASSRKMPEEEEGVVA